MKYPFIVAALWGIIILMTIFHFVLLSFTHSPLKQQYIPMKCIAIESNHLCYSCLFRDRLQWTFQDIDVETSLAGAAVVFKNKTGLYCDQLSQLIDTQQLMQNEALIFEDLEPIHQILDHFKGSTNRKYMNHHNLHSQHQEMIIFSKKKQGDSEAVVMIRHLSIQAYEALLIFLQLFTYLSIVANLIIQIVNIKTKRTQLKHSILRTAISILLIKCLHFHGLFFQSPPYKLLILLFFFLLINENLSLKQYLIFIGFLMDEPISFIFYLIAFTMFILKKNWSLNGLIVISALIIFIANKLLMFYVLSQWNKIISMMIQVFNILIIPLSREALQTVAQINHQKKNQSRTDEEETQLQH